MDVDVSVVANELGNSSDVLACYYLKDNAESALKKERKTRAIAP